MAKTDESREWMIDNWTPEMLVDEVIRLRKACTDWERELVETRAAWEREVRELQEERDRHIEIVDEMGAEIAKWRGEVASLQPVRAQGGPLCAPVASQTGELHGFLCGSPEAVGKCYDKENS